MDDMFIHGPAFQGVAMRIQTEIFPRQEPLPTPRTPMPHSREACDPAPEPAATLPEVKGQPGEPPILPPRQGSLTAKGTARAAEFDTAIDPEIVLALPAACVSLQTLEGGTGPDEDPIVLVIKIGTVVDKGEVRGHKICGAPLPSARRGDPLFPPRPLRSCLRGGWGITRGRRAGAHSIEELGHGPEGQTVLQVVGDERVLERRGTRGLPLPPPHNTLQPGGLHSAPATA